MRNLFMARAIELAVQNARVGQGGPFGAVVVKNGKIISWHAYYDSLPFLTALGVIPSQS